jgi:hypothetical protein
MVKGKKLKTAASPTVASVTNLALREGWINRKDAAHYRRAHGDGATEVNVVIEAIGLQLHDKLVEPLLEQLRQA